MDNATPLRKGLPMLLVEPDDLLRRTVALTARSLGMGDICEAASPDIASRLLRDRKFGGAVIALDFGKRQYDQYDLGLIDEIRRQRSADDAAIPIALMLSYCDAGMMEVVRERYIARIILKPFRARVLLDTFAEFFSRQSA